MKTQSETIQIESQNAFREHRYDDVIRLSGIDQSKCGNLGDALNDAVDALKSKFIGWDY